MSGPAAIAMALGEWALILTLATGLGLALGARGLTKRCLGLAVAQFAVAGLWVSVAPPPALPVADGPGPTGFAEAWAIAAALGGLMTLAVGLAVAVRLREAYGTHRLDEIDARAETDQPSPRGG